MVRLALALVLVAVPGCIEVGAFACQPGTCDLDGRNGVCEAAGWCSYPDDGCESGRRFESRAPNPFGGECVDPEGQSSSTGGTTTSTTLPRTTDPTDPSATRGTSSGGPECDGHGCGWTRVESGALHTCALDGNGAVWCWGVGASGELGIGSNASFRDCPAAPAGDLTDQQGLAVGGHTCAVGAEGLHCWGPNDQRQVDWSSSQDQFLEPHAVGLPEGEAVRSVGVGDGDMCVGGDAQLVCWGDGATMHVGYPTDHAVVALDVGDAHLCGMLADDTVQCFGSDAQEQLGGGEGDQSNMRVIPDLGGEAALALSVGARHTCAITEGDGPQARNVKCWGDNRANQAGGVADDEIDVPRDVSGNLVPGAWTDVAAGVVHSCAINEDGEVWCWGSNNYGQVDPHAAEFDQLLTADRIELDPDIEAVDIAVATTISCAIDRDAQWWCWGCLEPWMLVDGDACTVSPPTLFEPCR